MNEETISKPPVTSIVFGLIVYWVTMIGSFIVVIGAIVAFVSKANFVTPAYWFTSLWEGKSTANIWEGISSSTPVGHWYMTQLATGDGLSAFGLSLGVSSVTLALLVSAVMMYKSKSILFGTFSLAAALIIIVATLGLTPLPS